MKKFEFNLSTLLQVRTEGLNEAHLDLMRAHHHLQNMLNSIESLEKEYYILNEKIERTVKANLAVEAIAIEHEYLQKLEKRIKMQIEEVVKAQNKVEDKRQAVMRALQLKKIIENLYEKQNDIWTREYQLRESAFFDEISSIHWIRQKE